MKKIRSRTIHRFLGLVVGVQLFAWTLSGLIFSWNPIEKVRGEHLIHESQPVDLARFDLIDPARLFEREELSGSHVTKVELRGLLSRPVYEVATRSATSETSYRLFDAVSGDRLSPITQEQARRVAEEGFAPEAQALSVERVESVGSHSEYRGKELPAYRVVMDHPSGTAIYVSANRGLVTTRRSTRWRLFDFFWMLHTMDYRGRDDFNTWVLRAASILGLVTVLSGYWLWWRTSKVRGRRLAASRRKSA